MYSPRFIRITSGSADEILYVETGSIRAISSVVNVTMVSTWFAILDSSFFFFSLLANFATTLSSESNWLKHCTLLLLLLSSGTLNVQLHASISTFGTSCHLN